MENQHDLHARHDCLVHYRGVVFCAAVVLLKDQ